MERIGPIVSRVVAGIMAKNDNDNSETLNVEAILAGLRWYHDLAARDPNAADDGETFPLGFYQKSLVEKIHPGQPRSVTAGMDVARILIWGPQHLQDIVLQTSGPIGSAVRQYRAEVRRGIRPAIRWGRA